MTTWTLFHSPNGLSASTNGSLPGAPGLLFQRPPEPLSAPSGEGAFPVMGRSSTYRFGAFAHLSDMLRRGFYRGEGSCHALTAVIDRMMVHIFDSRNILTIGCVGKQEQIAVY